MLLIGSHRPSASLPDRALLADLSWIVAVPLPGKLAFELVSLSKPIPEPRALR